MGLFHVEDPVLNYYDGYIAVGMTANFTNTTFREDHPVAKLKQAARIGKPWI
jgi:hypothetical protein